jgi:alanine racemase
LQHDLTLAVGSLEMARVLAATARDRGTTARVHVKVDTGLSRFGIPTARAVDEIAAIAALPGLALDGVYTHFVASEEKDKGSARGQLALFQTVLDGLDARGARVPLRHAANSGALLDLPETHLDLVRAGIAIYGYHPAGPDGDRGGLRPALTLQSRLVRVEAVPAGTGVSYNHTFHTTQPSILGLVPLGYADGYPRVLSNRGHMLVRGQRCPIVGRVCMDQTVLDLTGVPGAAVGDPVVAIGRQGDECVDAEEVGSHAGTNSYETLCRIGPRVPRDYVDA